MQAMHHQILIEEEIMDQMRGERKRNKWTFILPSQKNLFQKKSILEVLIDFHSTCTPTLCYPLSALRVPTSLTSPLVNSGPLLNAD